MDFNSVHVVIKILTNNIKNKHHRISFTNLLHNKTENMTNGRAPIAQYAFS